ncbi:MAG: Gfo/Idh/MocA family oxidoreductase, partial [Candidatus Omnitrophica bacterium]|nr:Gfo/Idh/MocA family oxidoreductase [Candidatus Omnitrophota bacterium]
MIKVGVIGCGHWGPNHIRIFSHLANSVSFMCADLNEERLKKIKETFLNIKTTQNYKDILNHPEVDAVCIASPTDSHFTIAKEALEAGKHVLCEKPLSLDPRECFELERIAKDQAKILMVGHIFVFNAGIVKIKEYIQSGELGKIYYAYATRTNLGPFRYDVNALWDLAPHDISIFNYLFGSMPLNVSARG